MAESSFTSYASKLKDPRWRSLREKILIRDGYTCCECGERCKQLHVHHLQYDVSRNPWDVDDSALITLCEDCHAVHHSDLTHLEKFLYDHIVLLSINDKSLIKGVVKEILSYKKSSNGNKAN